MGSEVHGHNVDRDDVPVLLLSQRNLRFNQKTSNIRKCEHKSCFVVFGARKTGLPVLYSPFHSLSATAHVD